MLKFKRYDKKTSVDVQQKNKWRNNTMYTQNQLLMHSIYTAMTEASEKAFESKEERQKWEGQRTAEIFQELKAKYCAKPK